MRNIKLTILGLALASQATLAFAAAPRIVVLPKTLDFGKRGHGETPRATLKIRNAGDAPLVISGLKESCSCIKIGVTSPAPIAPGGEVTIPVSMSSGRALGSYFKKIRISSNDPRSPTVEVPVGMHILEGVEISERNVRFDGAVGGEPQVTTIDVTRKGTSAPGALRVEKPRFSIRFGQSRPGDFSVTTSPIPGGQRLTVKLAPSHPEGRIMADLNALVDGKRMTIPIAGEMFAWIMIRPTFVSFSNVSAANPASLVGHFDLSSTDGALFQIRDLSFDRSRARSADVDMRFSVKTSPDELSHRVTIHVTPKAFDETSSSFSGTVRILTDHPEKPELSVRYSGFYRRR